MKNKGGFLSTRTMVLVAVMTSLVVVLQLLGSFIRFGPFSISLVLVPIVIGAAVCGNAAGAWLGFAFGLAVLFSGDAAVFLAVNPFGTIVTVILKGTAAGLCAGLIYKYLAIACQKLNEKRKKININWIEIIISGIIRFLPVVSAAIICPVVNTGIFLIGCRVFFYDTIAAWGAGLEFKNAAEYMFLGLAGGNFIFELLTNLVLAPIIVRLLAINKKIFKF